MARGGKRTGTPGKSYPQRTDLQQPVRTATGQPYGAAGAQAAAQQAIPLPTQGAPGPPPVGPGDLGAFDRPTDRPDEHVTHGLPVGPGAGPEALHLPGSADDFGSQLRAVYQLFPNNDLLRLIEEMDNNP